MTRRVYRSPPIEEALCEFRFSPAGEWDLTIPGRLQNELRGEYQGKPRHQKVLSANVQLGTAPALSMVEGLARIQFPTEDEKALVSIGPDVLSIHVLKPYPGWEQFRPRIERALTAFRKVTELKGLPRIGLRYINRVALPEKGPLDLHKYFVGVASPPLPLTTTGFLHRTEYRYPDGVKLVVVHASLEPTQNGPAFLLDFDLIWEGDPVKGQQEWGALVDDLRARQREAFEAHLTDALREVFDAAG